MSTTSLPPNEQQIADSLTAYHSFVEAFRGLLGFTCIEMFEGYMGPDNTDPPFPLMKFRLDRSTIHRKECEWFKGFLLVWSYKQTIKWEFREVYADDPKDADFSKFYLLAPVNTNWKRDPWFVVNARHAGAQLGAFFIAWKYGLLHETAKLH